MQINFTLDTLDVSAEDVRLIESISRQLAIQVASRVATPAPSGYVAAEAMEAGTPVFVEGLGYLTSVEPEAKPVKVRKSRGIVKGLTVESEKETASTLTEDDLKREEADWEEYQAEKSERQAKKGEGISEEEAKGGFFYEESHTSNSELPQSVYTYKGKSIPFAKFLELYKSGEAKFEDFTFGKAPEGTDFKAISDLYRPKSTVAGNGAKYRAFLNWLGGLQSAKEAKSEVYLPILDFLTSL